MITQNFFGIFAPAGTPKPMLAQVNEATQTALKDTAFQKRLNGGGFEPMAGYGPEKSSGLHARRIFAVAEGRKGGRI